MTLALLICVAVFDFSRGIQIRRSIPKQIFWTGIAIDSIIIAICFSFAYAVI